jgi:hypothetical protein
MKKVYVTSVEPYSGKTSLCLALARRYQERGLKVGYLKPLSTQPWRSPDGRWADEDAAFVQSILQLPAHPAELSPVVVTHRALAQRLEGKQGGDPLELVRAAAEAAGKYAEVLLLEGGASLREGYAMGMANVQLAKALQAPAVALIRFHSEMQVLDDALATRFRLGELLLGAVVNRTPQEAEEFLNTAARRYLEREGIRYLGSLPLRPLLSALSLHEVQSLLEAQPLTRTAQPQALVEQFTVGAMTAEAALARFRRQANKAVITGGDRTDIQLAALETSTVALILTGNLRPSPTILEQAEARSIPVLLVKENTIETVERIERAMGKTRLGSAQKLEEFVRLAQSRLDLSPVDRAVAEEG